MREEIPMREELLRAILAEFGGHAGVAAEVKKTFNALMEEGRTATAARLLGQFLDYATEPEHKEPWQQ
jgi:hypothetical protein